MNDAARLIIILDKLPPLLTQGGDAVAKVMAAIFSSIAAPLGQIDKIEIVDVGGSGRGIDQMASVVPNVLFKFLAAARRRGSTSRDCSENLASTLRRRSACLALFPARGDSKTSAQENS